MSSLDQFMRRVKRLYHRARFEWLAGHPRYQDSLTLAREAKGRGDWTNAEVHFRAASIVRPDSVGPRINLGQALVELQRIDDARRVLDEALRREPRSAEAHLHLGHCLALLGDREAAVIAYARAAALKPPPQRADPAEAWSVFRETLSSPRPPHESDADAVVIMDGRGAPPSVLRGMLSGLTDQSDRRWIAVIRVDRGVGDHPGASFAIQDDRLHLVETITEATAVLEGQPPKLEIVQIGPNACLEPYALQSLRGVNRLCQADVVYGDHDHHHQSVRARPRWFGPALFGAPATQDLKTVPSPPVVLHFPNGDWRALLGAEVEGPGETLNRMMESGLVVRHIPLLIASIRVVAGSTTTMPTSQSQPRAQDKAFPRITVIVPTRDEPAVLDACVRSLTACADRPEDLDIVVLDNRSHLAETADTLHRLEETLGLTSLAVDEPFNWSRLNNIGAAHAVGEILVFANNDIEMLTSGWDRVVRTQLSDPEVGIVGARLLYPDGTLQHVGVVLGAVGGRPVHEGRAEPAAEGGPQNRWRRTREVGAVTGAFLAVRSETFLAAGGFNENLAVAYNDLDFCLRVRSLGKAVVYASEIEAIHFESKTRGLAATSEKIAWDDEEFEQLYRIWGDACTHDPYVHPAWTFSTESAFNGFRPVSDADSTRALAGDDLKSSSQRPPAAASSTKEGARHRSARKRSR
ncbi:hypothetical protein BH10PSE2_BH10PSE2_07520 [soil metagenome]